MEIDFTLEDAEAIDKILSIIRNGGSFEVRKEDVSESEYAGLKLCCNFLKENKLVKSVSFYHDGLNACIITSEGVALLDRGGVTSQFLKEQQKEDRASEIERLTKENLELQQNDFEYNKKIRLWKFVSLILGIIVALLTIYSFFMKH